MTPRDIIELKTTGNKYTETVTDVLEFEDTVFRVRFDGFWIVGASSRMRIQSRMGPGGYSVLAGLRAVEPVSWTCSVGGPT